MTIVVTDKDLALAKFVFAEARIANGRADSAESTDGRRDAYLAKASAVSRLLCECSEYCVVDFDHGTGDTVSVRLKDTEPKGGLHIPLSQLSPSAFEALRSALNN